MSTPPTVLSSLLLRLFPRRFRASFAAEWQEAADWHWQRLEGRPLRPLRYALLLCRDSATAIPVAHLAGVRARLGEVVPGGAEIAQSTRALARARSYTAASVASLALGVGAATAVFTVVDAVLLDGLPYTEGERLHIVWNEFTSGAARLPLSGAQVAELQAEPGLFEAVGGIWASSATLQAADGATRPVRLGVVSPNFFDVLGVKAALGAGFEADRGAGAPPAGVVIAHELWRTALGADPGIIGRLIEVDGESVEVVAVLPPDFRLHFPPDGSIPAQLDVYEPLPWDLTYLPPAQRFLRVVGRLAPGVSADAAALGVASAGARARQTDPELAASGDRLTVFPLHADAVRRTRPALLALLAGSICFTLLAAANMASLGLARGLARRREFAVRQCLGGSRGRLARLLALESLWLGALGGGLGLWLGVYGGAVIWRLRPAGVSLVDEVSPDARVFLFGTALAATAVLLAGVAPWITLPKRAPAIVLRGGTTGGSRGRLREGLVAAELAVGLVLVVSAVLFSQSLGRLLDADVGFDRTGTTVVRVPLPRAVFPDDAERARLATEIEGRLASIAGVEAVGATSHPPFVPWANWAGKAPPVDAAEAEAELYFFDHRAITPGYFEAIRANLAEGRGFHDGDGAESQPVIVIDRVVAERAFPGESAVGRELLATRYIDGGFVVEQSRVVGVVESMRDVDPALASNGQVFWPFQQSARWELTWVLRGAADLEFLAGEVRAAVAAVDGRITAGGLEPLDRHFRVATARARYLAMLGVVLSGVALLLAAIGLHGVLAYLAEQQLPSMGVRRALGARGSDVASHYLREGLRIGGVGIGIGVALALVVGRFLESLLFEVSPSEPRTLVAVALGFLLVTLAASVRPALWASRTDPVRVLRPSRGGGSL